jgi:hypothetical protein
MIVPTIGRVVWIVNRYGAYRRNNVKAQPEVGLIAFVHDDRLINVAGFDMYGLPFALTEVTLLQDGDPVPDNGYAQWMPYQVATAKGEIPAVRHASPESSSNR